MVMFRGDFDGSRTRDEIWTEQISTKHELLKNILTRTNILINRTDDNFFFLSAIISHSLTVTLTVRKTEGTTTTPVRECVTFVMYCFNIERC